MSAGQLHGDPPLAAVMETAPAAAAEQRATPLIPQQGLRQPGAQSGARFQPWLVLANALAIRAFSPLAAAQHCAV